MNLLNCFDLAEKLRFVGTDKQKQQWMQNLLQTKTLPKEITIKVGRYRLVVEELLDEWLEKKMKNEKVL